MFMLDAAEVNVNLAALLSFLTPLMVAVIAYLQHRKSKSTDEKLEVIRVDVNSNLTQALKEVEELAREVDELRERLELPPREPNPNIPPPPSPTPS